MPTAQAVSASKHPAGKTDRGSRRAVVRRGAAISKIHPMVSPMRNGQAVSAMPATVFASSCEERPPTAKATTHTTSTRMDQRIVRRKVFCTPEPYR